MGLRFTVISRDLTDRPLEKHGVAIRRMEACCVWWAMGRGGGGGGGGGVEYEWWGTTSSTIDVDRFMFILNFML